MVPSYKPYNPLDKKNLGRSISNALTQQPALPLDSLDQFNGVGCYLIYYVGDFPPYQKMAQQNTNGSFEMPIYVGKAVPSGARKGSSLDGSVPKPVLHSRLREHASSIIVSDNLNINDFYCRFLVVDDIWIPLAEQLAIAMFAPIWNQLIDGFGNHNPGKGRYNQAISKWDVLHPGREWARKLPKRAETQIQIEQEVLAYLSSK